jgi:3-oxoacyl-[acyl-carrier protein] reductase
MVSSRGLGDVYKRQADEIAAAVAFLASPKAAYVSGTTLHVNGGMYMI